MQRLLICLATTLVLAACTPVPGRGTCTDGVRNGDESDADCGGADCGPCELERACYIGDDCASGTCARHVCVATACAPGECGGKCGGCADGAPCAAPADCESGVCTGNVCAAPSCMDQVHNGTESDVDCGGGGSACPPCPPGASCRRSADCVAGACIDGTCALSCAAPLLQCGPECVDPRVNPMHCGGCGMMCGPGELCEQSACVSVCPAGTRACGPGCVGLDDVFNCGACGNACQPGERCIANTCTLTCAPNQTKCGNQCVQTMTDPLHCGGCGMPCAPGAVCSQGTCMLSCQAPLSTCNGQCADTRFDPDHCGDCATVCPPVPHASRLCMDMFCYRTSCDTGFADCNGMLNDGCEAELAIDTMNCGVCGRQCLGGPCVGGICP